MTGLRLVSSTPRAPSARIGGFLAEAGWAASRDGHRFYRNGAVWSAVGCDGSSTLTCPDGAVIPFSADVPAVVVVSACLAAADTA